MADGGKQGILITQLNVNDNKSKSIKERKNLMKESSVREEDLIKEEEKETKHHIFVMQTTDNEETELITIAEPPNSLGKYGTMRLCDGEISMDLKKQY